MNAFGQHRRGPAVLIEVNQANVGSGAAELLRQGVLILHFAIGGDMAANAKHGRGTRNQIKKTAGFFVEAKAHHRQSLTEAQIVPG